jgi:hypothetical protein
VVAGIAVVVTTTVVVDAGLEVVVILAWPLAGWKTTTVLGFAGATAPPMARMTTATAHQLNTWNRVDLDLNLSQSSFATVNTPTLQCGDLAPAAEPDVTTGRAIAH